MSVTSPPCAGVPPRLRSAEMAALPARRLRRSVVLTTATLRTVRSGRLASLRRLCVARAELGARTPSRVRAKRRCRAQAGPVAPASARMRGPRARRSMTRTMRKRMRRSCERLPRLRRAQVVRMLTWKRRRGHGAARGRGTSPTSPIRRRRQRRTLRKTIGSSKPLRCGTRALVAHVVALPHKICPLSLQPLSRQLCETARTWTGSPSPRT
jgi:hypothetical protein